MRVVDFLERFIEGYLFADLETLRNAGPEQVLRDGHVGYPMFMACAAGIEVLGLLISPDKYTEQSSRGVGVNGPSKNFVRYWKTYLYREEPESEVGAAIFQLARNGIAHTFAAKSPAIAKRGPHLKQVDGVTRINVVDLANDFRGSYSASIRPLLNANGVGFLGETVQSMDERLGEMLALDAHRIGNYRDALSKLPAAASALEGLNSGATDDVRHVVFDLTDLEVASQPGITGSIQDPAGIASSSTVATIMQIVPSKK
jgi:hypothetical protein